MTDTDREWVFCVTLVHGTEHIGPITSTIRQGPSTTRSDLIGRIGLFLDDPSRMIGLFLNDPSRMIVHYLERNDL